jgi:hypothetical protein
MSSLSWNPHDAGLIAGGVVGFLGLWVLAKLRMQYHVGRTALRVRLGRLTLRKINLSDIERVSKPRRDLNWWSTENWRNAFDGSHRLLVVHRRSGLFRRLVITPKHRYEFRERLRTAIAIDTGQALAEEPGDSADSRDTED